MLISNIKRFYIQQNVSNGIVCLSLLSRKKVLYVAALLKFHQGKKNTLRHTPEALRKQWFRTEPTVVCAGKEEGHWAATVAQKSLSLSAYDKRQLLINAQGFKDIIFIMITRTFTTCSYGVGLLRWNLLCWNGNKLVVRQTVGSSPLRRFNREQRQTSRFDLIIA